MTAFRATYSDWKLIRTRKVVQIVLEVSVEQADQAYRVLGGMPNSGEETWVGVARLEDGNAEVAPASPGGTARAKGAVDVVTTAPKRLIQQVAMACKQPKFQTWVKECLDPNHEGGLVRTEVLIREYCGVKSRSEILPGTEAARRWDRLYSRYVAWDLVE